ncbi:MAG: hypothetical protein RLY70_4945 [Planctomycetota bacterium]|jgi:hypothetical protein
MQLNRNHYFAAGVVALLLGWQLRHVDSFVLNEKASTYLAQQFSEGPSVAAVGPDLRRFLMPTPQFRRTVRPPRWVGFSLLSLGGVLVLHSFAMRPAGGG